MTCCHCHSCCQSHCPTHQKPHESPPVDNSSEPDETSSVRGEPLEGPSISFNLVDLRELLKDGILDKERFLEHLSGAWDRALESLNDDASSVNYICTDCENVVRTQVHTCP